jgi:hypothetical protein
MVGKWHGDEYVVFDAWDLNAPSWGQGHYFMQNREGAMAYAVERAGFVRAGQLAEV